MVFANLKRVIQCACFKSPGSKKGAPKCNLHILAVAHLLRKWRLVSSSSLQREHNVSLTLCIIVRCRLRVLRPVRRHTSILRSRRHCRNANCVSPGVTWVTSSFACQQPSVLSQCLLCTLWAHCRTLLRTAIVENPKAMYTAAAACFASLSASSLPTISLWPMFRSSVIVWKSESNCHRKKIHTK